MSLCNCRGEWRGRKGRLHGFKELLFLHKVGMMVLELAQLLAEWFWSATVYYLNVNCRRTKEECALTVKNTWWGLSSFATSKMVEGGWWNKRKNLRPYCSRRKLFPGWSVIEWWNLLSQGLYLWCGDVLLLFNTF